MQERTQGNETNARELAVSHDTISDLQKEIQELKSSKESPKVKIKDSEKERNACKKRIKESYKIQLPTAQDNDDTDNTGSDFGPAFDDDDDERSEVNSRLVVKQTEEKQSHKVELVKEKEKEVGKDSMKQVSLPHQKYESEIVTLRSKLKASNMTKQRLAIKHEAVRVKMQEAIDDLTRRLTSIQEKGNSTKNDDYEYDEDEAVDSSLGTPTENIMDIHKKYNDENAILKRNNKHLTAALHRASAQAEQDLRTLQNKYQKEVQRGKEKEILLEKKKEQIRSLEKKVNKVLESKFMKL